MAKLKDGFYKLTAQSIGSDLLVLLSGGGAKPISDFASAFNVKLWGQPFDGTYNVNGDFTVTSGSKMQLPNGRELITFHNDFFVLGYDNCPSGVSTYLDGYDIRFRTGNSWSTSMLIDGYGNVGIGTTSPTSKLDVNGIITATISSPSSSVAFRACRTNATNDDFGVDINLFAYQNKGLTIGGGGYGGIFGYYNGSTFSEILRLSSSGNVGIGNSTPSEKLDIVGRIKISGIGGAGVVQYKGSNKVFSLGSGASSTDQGTECGILQLFHNGTEMIRLYAESSASWINAGNVGIGTTNPQAKLHVNGGCIMLSVNNNWLSPANLQIGRLDTTVYSDRGCVGITDGNLHLDAYKDKKIYLNYYLAPGTVGLESTALIVDANGNTGIGITPTYKLHVNGDVYGHYFANSVESLKNHGSLTAVSGTTTMPYGLRLYSVYDNGYPCTYGNLLRIGGGGSGELVCGWTADSSLGRLYYRSKRDVASLAWSGWGTVAWVGESYTKSESDSRYVNVTGDTMTGALTIGQKVSSRKATWLKLITPGHTGSDAWCIMVDDTTSYSIILFGYTADAPIFHFRTDGALLATHFYESSDIILKTNILDIIKADKIPTIRQFDWKSDGTHSYGLIAQELEEMGYSELVDSSGDHKTVKYSAALSLIVGKLQVKIKELEKEIEILKNKN